MNLIHKTCVVCGISKPRKANFSKHPGKPDGHSVNCRTCQKAIKDGKKRRPSYSSAQQRSFSSGVNGLLLDAVWRGYADWREVTASYSRGRSNLRAVQNGGQGLHPLGTAAPQTAWRGQ